MAVEERILSGEKEFPVDKEGQATAFVGRVYGDWKDMLAFVTEHVAFDMRNVVKRARRNYYGVFQEPFDDVTLEEKYWVPLTETIVETGVKTADLDSKNFQLYTANELLPGYARVYQHLFNDKLRRMKWGALLNDVIRNAFIDGTQVIKKMRTYDRERRRWVNTVQMVDRLNFYSDPNVADLDESPIKIERAVIPLDEFRRYRNLWDKTGPEHVKGTQDTRLIDDEEFGDEKRETPMVIVWDVWGKIPKGLITGSHSDMAEVVNGHIVISGLLGEGGKRVVHLIEENKDPFDPYEAIRPRRVPRRFDGRGPAEQLFGSQEYVNMTVNLRKNNALVLQNGLFKAKVGKGITSDVVAQAVAGGVIPVYDMDDFQQLPVQDTRQSSYRDESSTVDWAQRVTFASDALQGSDPNASKAATVATIQDRNSRSAFDLMDENIGMGFSRFFERHILPGLAEEYDRGEIVRVTGRPSDFETIDKALVEHKVNRQVLEYIDENVSIPPASWVEDEKRKARNKLKKMGKNRHVRATKELLKKRYGLELTVVNDRIDRNLIIQQLKEIMGGLQDNQRSRFDQDKVIEKILFLMGLDPSDIEKDEEPKQEVPQEIPRSQGANALTGAVAPQRNAARVAPRRPGPAPQESAEGQRVANAGQRFVQQAR